MPQFFLEPSEPLGSPIDPEVSLLLILVLFVFENHVTYTLIILSCQKAAARDQLWVNLHLLPDMEGRGRLSWSSQT